MTNIKDVAIKAGVSVSTVSRVMNNRGYISQATKDKVFNAMKDLNYQPNEIAKSLFKKKSNIIGLILPDISTPFYAEETRYIEEELYKLGYKLMLCNAYNSSTREQEYINMLLRNQVDGIIIGSHTLKIEDYLNLNLPIVALDRYLGDDIPVVSADHMEGGKLAALELLNCGCTNILHFSGSSKVPTPSNDRHKSFNDTLEGRNVKVNTIELPINFFSFSDYSPIIQEALDNNPNIDGVFATDTIALATIKELSKRNINVPKEVKVVGYDGLSICALTYPSLTTIQQPIKELSKQAVKTLMNLINKINTSIEKKIVLPVSLERGNTTLNYQKSYTVESFITR